MVRSPHLDVDQYKLTPPARLAVAVIEQARLELGRQRFIDWIGSETGLAWLYLAGIENENSFAALIIKKLAL